MALPLSNNFMAGSTGQTITTANSGGTSGNAFDATTGTVPIFSNLATFHNGISLDIQGNGAVEWTSTSVGTPNDIWGRAYVYMTGLPAANCVVIATLTPNSATTRRNVLRINTTGKVGTLVAAGTAVASATTLAFNQWYRLEFHFHNVVSGTGTLDCTIYRADEVTALETMTQATGTLGASDTSLNQVWIGSASTTAPDLIFVYGVQVNGTGFPGPEPVPNLNPGPGYYISTATGYAEDNPIMGFGTQNNVVAGIGGSQMPFSGPNSFFESTDINQVDASLLFSNYTDSGTPIVAISASGADTLQAVDANTSNVGITASGVDTAQRVDTGTATPHFTASGADVAAFVDTGKATVGITASGTELVTRGNPDIPYPEGIKQNPAAKPGPPLGPQGSFQESRTIYQQIVEPTTQAVVTVTASGVETRSHADAGTATVGVTASGVDTAQRVDSGNPQVTITPSGTDVRTGVGPSDDNIGGWLGDVAVGAPGNVASWTLNFNKTVPAGNLLIVTVLSTSHSATGVTDSQSNSYTDWDSLSIAGVQVHLHTYVSQLTNTVTPADTLSGTLLGANDCVIVATAYQGVIASSPEDSPAKDKTATTLGTSNATVSGNATAQPYETFYVAYGLDNRATNLIYDNTFAQRTNMGNSSGSRFITIMDKPVYSTVAAGTITTLSWTNLANAGSIFIPIKMAKLPSIARFTPSGTDTASLSDVGQSTLNTTPSIVTPAVFIDSGKALPTYRATSSSEAYNLRPPDTGQVSLTTDVSDSTEVFAHSEKSTLLVNTSQPFRQDIVQFVETGTSLLKLTPGNATQALGVIDSCLHCTLTPRWSATPVGARWSGNGFVRYATKVSKRWRAINVGKCPT